MQAVARHSRAYQAFAYEVVRVACLSQLCIGTCLLLTQHFPAHQRYVALFADRERKDPVAPDAQASDRAQVQAAEFLTAVRKSMKRGEMSAEPEMELERRQAAKAASDEEEEQEEEQDDEDDEEDVDEDAEDVDNEDDDDAASDNHGTTAPHSLAQDDFFAL